MIKRKARKQTSRKGYLEIKNFRGGSNSLLDEARLDITESKQATNLIQVQDGLWKPRWGTAYYGEDLGANPDGSSEFVKSDGTTELISIADGKAYKSTDGGSWTEITGATFTAGNQCYFMQIANFLYIANGVDTLTRYDGTDLLTYTEIDPPTNLTASIASGMSSGTYTFYAEVTALNDVGETVGSIEASMTTNKPRDTWVTGSDIVDWSWNAVATANRYQLYLSEEAGDEIFLASTPNTSFRDDGTNVLNQFIVPPLSNTTSAPKFKSMVTSGNRIWATYDPDNLYTVYFSGTGQYIGNFSYFYGGGWINLEKGGRELPTKVLHYQTGTGDGRATVLARTPEGRGAVWQIEITSATIDEVTFSIPSAQKIVGSFGTDSILGTVSTDNDVLFPNKRGMYSLGPEKNYYGILRTKELTSRIRPYWRSLIGSKLKDIASYFYDSKVFISVPTDSSGNTKTIVYDLERMNWTVDWSIAAKQWFEYTDTKGTSHLMYVPMSGTQLVEVGENIEGDLGAAYSTVYSSGRIQLNKYWKDFQKVTNVYVKLGNPKGAIGFEVLGTERNKPFRSLGSSTIVPTSSNTGMGFDLMGDVLMGDTDGTPSTFSDSSDPRFIKIRKRLRDLQLRVTTDLYGADYVLQGIIIEGKMLNTTPPSAWKI